MAGGLYWLTGTMPVCHRRSLGRVKQRRRVAGAGPLLASALMAVTCGGSAVGPFPGKRHDHDQRGRSGADRSPRAASAAG